MIILSNNEFMHALYGQWITAWPCSPQILVNFFDQFWNILKARITHKSFRSIMKH